MKGPKPETKPAVPMTFLEKMTKIPKMRMVVARNSVRKLQNVLRTAGPVEKTASFNLQAFDEIDMDKRDMPRLGDLGSGMGNVD